MDTALTKFTYLEANLARKHLRRKRRTYHSLSSINQHFASISRHVWQLEKAGFMPIARIHQTLRVTPAMEAKLTDQVWSIEELVALMPETTVSASRIEKELLAKALAMQTI